MPSVKRNDRVVVEDVAVYEGLIVVVIGVMAIVRVRREDGTGDTYRVAEVCFCRRGSARAW